MSANVPLRAVIVADIAGYSRLLGGDATRMPEVVDNCLLTVKRECQAHGGDLVKVMGDGFIALFESATAALEFASRVHRLAGSETPEEVPQIRFRIGMHLGEVHKGAVDVHGYAVNVAARLEALAEPGSTLVSHDVYRLVRAGSHFAFKHEGVPILKNISERIPTYRVIDEPGAVASAPIDPVAVSVFGCLAVSIPGGGLTLPRSDALLGMIGCLALAGSHQIRQEKLTALLWPDRSQNDARRALRRVLRLARRSFAGAGSVTVGNDGERVWLSDSSVTVDLDLMLERVRLGQVDKSLLDFPGWDDQLAPELDRFGSLMKAWLQVARKHWRRELAIALEDCIERFDPREEGARRAAIALLNLEPGHEPASRKLIGYYIARGNRAAAMDEYDRLAVHLATNFGLEPAAESKALVSALPGTRGEPAGAERPSVPAMRVRKLQITVGHFSGDSPYLIFGFRQELLANLSRFREWAILERSDNELEMDSATGGGNYTLEGYLRKSDEDQQMVIWLLEDGSRRVVWSDSFEISIDNWQALQRHVIGRVAATLEIYISADRLAYAIAPRGDAAASFDAWLRGEQLLSHWTPEAEDEAAAMFRRIIADDPNFAPAYASLASIHNVRHVVRPGLRRDAEQDLAAFALAQRAVELDPLDARSHLAVAWTAALTGAFDQASVHLDLAMTLNPNSPRTAISAAMGYAWFGDCPKAVQLLEHALSITPMLLEYQWCYAASVWLLSDNYERALEATARSGDAIADNQGWRAAILAKLGRNDEAHEALLRLVEAVAPRWVGEEAVSPAAVFEWFTGAYPIRRAEDRAKLADALASAMTGAGGAAEWHPQHPQQDQGSAASSQVERR